MLATCPLPGVLFFFFPRTIFNIKIDIDLFQGRPHAWALEIRKHDELDIGRGLEIMQLVLIGAVRDKAININMLAHRQPLPYNQP